MTNPKNDPTARKRRLAQLRPVIRKLDARLDRMNIFVIRLETEPGAKPAGAFDALLAPANRAMQMLLELLETGDALRAALRRRASPDDEIARLDHLFERDRLRFLQAVVAFDKSRVGWLIRARKWQRIAPVVDPCGRELFVPDLALREFTWMTARRRRSFDWLKEKYHELAQLRREYSTFIERLAYYRGPDVPLASKLATEVGAVFPAVRAASRGLFRLLEIAHDGNATESMVANAVRERRGVFEKLDQQSQALAPQIAAWLADYPLDRDGN